MSLTTGAATTTVQHYYELVDANDIDGLLDLFTPDAVYHRPGYAPLIGRAELERFYSADRVIARGTHSLHTVVACDDEVAAHGEFSGTLKDGSQVTVRFADFFAVREDGRFARRDTFFFSPVV
ncbi:steroid delta-isomerase [Kitasatospora sp. MAP12-15]|uniref:nuclear transport factor 2 family protein n=1 Tax=unclassified Kitasatospora TaxID=2633591 RepID=UPI0024761F3C|nr:nuclear transport factor 2 family protein [Kitasatospora sp. MAP12-44]MDH6108603.1 steroid delta-isomerase [Kitasatospora sp. MAP12-44]